ncbi:Uncharacterised protein [Chlamydia trachomatis]|nr:Uncharacterised protein [Chlamydia trachomatis]
MSKEFGVDCTLRDGPTIDSYIGAVLSDTILMYELWKSLLSYATFPSHQYTYVGGRNEKSHFYGASKPCRVPHNPKTALGLSYFVAILIHMYIIWYTLILYSPKIPLFS